MPAEHLLCKIDAAVALNKVYDREEPLFSAGNGHPSADPAVLLKMFLVLNICPVLNLRVEQHRKRKQTSTIVGFRGTVYRNICKLF